MAAIDRVDICNAVKGLFQADSTLYGEKALINKISVNEVEFEKARITVQTPYKMFLKANQKTKLDTRMDGNADYEVIIEYRIEGLRSNPETAREHIDDIDERMDYLLDNEMWTGGELSAYYTNSESDIIDIEWQGSNCNVNLTNNIWNVECEGTIRIVVNRVKP